MGEEKKRKKKEFEKEKAQVRVYSYRKIKDDKLKAESSVRNGAVRPSWARTRTDDIVSSRPVIF